MLYFPLKKQIRDLAYLLFILTFLSMSFEIALKSGSSSSFSDLFMPVMNAFYWPRFVIFQLPSLVIIILSSINKRYYERILKALFIFAAPIVVGLSINLYSSYKLIIPFHQPEQFIQLYYVTLFSKTVVLLGITLLGIIWTFQKKQKTVGFNSLDLQRLVKRVGD